MKIIRRPYHHAGSCFFPLRRALPSYVCMKIDWIFMRSFTFCDRPTVRPTTGRGGKYSSLTEIQWQTTRFYLDARAFAGKWGRKNWIAFGSIKIELLRRLILFRPMTENNWVELGRYINKSVGPTKTTEMRQQKKYKGKIVCTRSEKQKTKTRSRRFTDDQPAFRRLECRPARFHFSSFLIVSNTVSGGGTRRTKFIHPKIGYTMIFPIFLFTKLVHIISLSVRSFRRGAGTGAERGSDAIYLSRTRRAEPKANVHFVSTVHTHEARRRICWSVPCSREPTHSPLFFV